MRVGYAVPALPELASYRLRVAIPAKHLGVPYSIGATGNPTFFFKNGNVRLAESLPGKIVYDVVNDHFSGKHAADYHGMCRVADVITCASEGMAKIVKSHTGRDAAVIDDPYENDESEAECGGSTVLWFGHGANIASLVPYADLYGLVVCSNVKAFYGRPVLDWNNRLCEDAALFLAGVVLLTGDNPGASANRVVKAIRAGRFVVVPSDCAESWKQLRDYIWIGDVREGVKWAFNNREEACKKTLAGQHYIRQRYSPQSIGSQWAGLFASTLAADTRNTKDGSGLTSP